MEAGFSSKSSVRGSAIGETTTNKFFAREVF